MHPPAPDTFVRRPPAHRLACVLMVAVVVALAAPFDSVSAQTPDSIAVADTVRVTVPGNTYIYELRGVTADSIIVADVNGTRSFSRAEVERLEVGSRQSWAANTLRWVPVWTAVGAAGGFLLDQVFGDIQILGPPDTPEERREEMLQTVALGAAYGAAAGLLYGATRPLQWRWRTVDPGDLAVQLAPASDGVGIGVVWRH